MTEPTLDEIYQALAGCWCTDKRTHNTMLIRGVLFTYFILDDRTDGYHCLCCHEDVASDTTTGERHASAYNMATRHATSQHGGT